MDSIARQYLERAATIMRGDREHPVFPRKAGAKDLLVALAARGVPMGVALSTRRKEVLRRRLAVGFDGHFHSVIGGDEF
jgi:beta-phosphoglucomutase-like phosphatase (HAD superfamily)